MALRSNPSDQTKITLSTYVTAEHARLVHEAAALQGETASCYMRRLVLMCTAADLNIEIDQAAYAGGDLVAKAARKLGLEPKEFERRAAFQAASEALGLRDTIRETGEKIQRLRQEIETERRRISERPPTGSGERKAAGIGRRH